MFKAIHGFLKAKSSVIITSDNPQLNRTCTWFEYDDYDYSSAESINDYNSLIYGREFAMEKCMELGRNKCNAVRTRQMICWRCPPVYSPIFVVGEATKPTDASYTTWIVGECNIWQKWPSHYLGGKSIESKDSLDEAQKRCHELGPICTAVKRNRAKYWLVDYQEIPTKREGTWSDYWIKLAANN